MDLERALLDRRSIRRFKRDVPPDDVVQNLVRMALAAPSPMNRQDWRFTAIRMGALHEAIKTSVAACWDRICDENEGSASDALRGYKGHFSAFDEAPLLLVIDVKRPARLLEHAVGDRAERIQGDLISAGMAIQNLMLAAHHQGLGTCVFTGCIAAEEELIRLLGLGHQRRIAALVALGYPDETPMAPARCEPTERLRFLA